VEGIEGGSVVDGASKVVVVDGDDRASVGENGAVEEGERRVEEGDRGVEEGERRVEEEVESTVGGEMSEGSVVSVVNEERENDIRSFIDMFSFSNFCEKKNQLFVN
jgi:hypothetical protein